MVDIQSKEVIDKISDELKIQPSLEIPRQLGKDIQLAYEVNPRILTNLAVTLDRAASGGLTIFTTDTERDTYITGVIHTFSKDVACDVASGVNKITVEDVSGLSFAISEIAILTLTAEAETVHATLKHPIKLKKGSLVLLGGNNSFAAGLFSRAVTVIGYTTDPQ